ncbi:MAG: hypothetical protein EBT36_10325 [Betaproteobacteria bacterium]|nr:hypothetical protein [Betaproteobacteria bacterium]
MVEVNEVKSDSDIPRRLDQSPATLNFPQDNFDRSFGKNEKIIREDNSFRFPFPIVSKHPLADFSASNNVERIDDILEPKPFGRGEKLFMGECSCVEFTTRVQELAASGSSLSVSDF